MFLRIRQGKLNFALLWFRLDFLSSLEASCGLIDTQWNFFKVIVSAILSKNIWNCLKFGSFQAIRLTLIVSVFKRNSLEQFHCVAIPEMLVAMWCGTCALWSYEMDLYAWGHWEPLQQRTHKRSSLSVLVLYTKRTLYWVIWSRSRALHTFREDLKLEH